MVDLNTTIQQGSQSLSSVMKSANTSQHSTLKNVLKDVRAAHPDMDRGEQMRLSKTIKQLGEDPSKVLGKKQKKMALKALDAAGHLKHKYAKNLGAAIKELDRHAQNPQTETLSELKEKRPSELTAAERKQLKKKQNQMRARAAQEREEAEGKFHAGNHETTRFGLEEWKGASVSANSAQKRQSRYALQDDDDSKNNSHTSSSRSTPPIVDMMID